jgi:CDGSH-type Zn-finger protein
MFTCKGCDNRKPACHGTCEKYKREKDQHEEMKARMKADREFEAYIAQNQARRNRKK